MQLSQFWTLSIVLSFIKKSTQLYRFARTSQETHYVFARAQLVNAIDRFVTMVY
jgi:hypothetical protein